MTSLWSAPLSIIKLWKKDLARLEATQATRSRLATQDKHALNTFYVDEIERMMARIEAAERRATKPLA